MDPQVQPGTEAGQPKLPLEAEESLPDPFVVLRELSMTAWRVNPLPPSSKNGIFPKYPAQTIPAASPEILLECSALYKLLILLISTVSTQGPAVISHGVIPSFGRDSYPAIPTVTLISPVSHHSHGLFPFSKAPF